MNYENQCKKLERQIPGKDLHIEHQKNSIKSKDAKISRIETILKEQQQENSELKIQMEQDRDNWAFKIQ